MAATKYTSNTNPAGRAIAVTPNDNVDIAFVSRGVYVGGTGDLTVVMADDGTTQVFVAVPAGAVLPIAVSRVKSTGTSASSIVALY